MKRIFATILLLCLVASAFCLSAFAADESDLPEPAADVVLRITGLKMDEDDPVLIEDCKDLVEGWNKAIALALNKKEMKKQELVRIVVDIYSDWTAVKGEFCNNGDGFSYDAIYFPAGVCVTLNLNGHTINRAMSTWEYNGEVICIDENADVIINGGKEGDPIVMAGENPDNVKMGTIKGGRSCNGAGGIHIHDEATVTLNNVNVIENRVDDDNGGGIAIYDGATLNMNGGAVSDNISKGTLGTICEGVGIYAYDSTVNLKKVKISNNQCLVIESSGAAIGAVKSDINMEDCLVLNNGLTIAERETTGAFDIIDIDSRSTLVATNVTFSGNGSHEDIYIFGSRQNEPDRLIDLHGSAELNNCIFSGNYSCYLIRATSADIKATNSQFYGNLSTIIKGSIEEGSGSFFKNCTVKNNSDSTTFDFNKVSDFTFIDCNLHNSTFSQKNSVKFESTGAASIFADGSLTMVISLIALISSAAAIGVSIALNVKKNKEEN